MANYAADATATYDPQQQAEAASLSSGRDQAISDLGAEAKNIDPYYNDAIKGAQQVRDQEGYKADQSSVLANGGSTSGLLANEQHLLGQDLSNNVTKLDSERAAKKSDVDRRIGLTNNDYSASMNALVQKYAGLKAGYISDHVNADNQRAADQAFQREQADRTNSFNMKMAQFNAAQTDKQYAAAHANDANDARSAYNSDMDGVTSMLDKFRAGGYQGGISRAKDMIGQLATKYANKGISQKEIQSTVNGIYHNFGLDHLTK